MCSNNVPVSHCKDTYYFDKTNNYFKKVKEKETRCLVSSIRNLPSYSTKNPQISPSNPNQNTEQHCGFDQQTSEHSRNDIHPREACTVNQLLEEGGDEDANCSSERKEQHRPMRHLMCLEYHGNGNQGAGKTSDSEVSPLVKSPSGEKCLEIVE